MTEGMGLTSVGAVVEQALDSAGVKVPAISLIGCSVDNMPADRMTVTAESVQSGIIVVGDAKVLTNDPIRAFRSYRWRLNPFEVRRGCVVNKGSILLDSKVRVTCTKCNATHVIWRDAFIRECAKNQQAGRTQDRAMLCNSCAVKGVHSEMSHASLYTRTLDDGRPDCDWVYPTPEEDDLIALLKAQSEGRKDEDITILPRIWGVYPKNKAPGDWVPVDQEADGIFKRLLTTRNCVIRPFDMVYKSKSAELRAVIMSGSRSLRLGWLDQSKLDIDDKLCFKRRLRYAPKERFSKNPYEV